MINFENPNDHWRKRREDSEQDSMKTILITLAFVIIWVIIVSLLSGCTTTKYVPVTETRTEHHWHTDSVKERDSTHTERETIIREVDSAAMAKYGIQMHANQRAWLVLQREMENRLRELEHMSANKDTVRDTIPKPYPVMEYVERKRTTFEWLLIIVGIAALFGGIIWLANKIKKYLII